MYDEIGLIWAVFWQTYASICGNVMGEVTPTAVTGTISLPFWKPYASNPPRQYFASSRNTFVS